MFTIEQQLAESWIEIARLIRERDFWKTSYEGLYAQYVAAQSRHHELKEQFKKMKLKVQDTYRLMMEVQQLRNGGTNEQVGIPKTSHDDRSCVWTEGTT